MKLNPLVSAIITISTLSLSGQSHAANLWSVDDSYLGPGVFYGPGAFPTPTKLFGAVIRKMSFHTDRDFVTPFHNNGEELPNIRGEQDFDGIVDGMLSDGTKINENVDLGVFVLAGTKVLPAVVDAGNFYGKQVSVTREDGNIIMSMDLVLDTGLGSEGIIKLPFYGTTGTVTMPHSLQTQNGDNGVDRAGTILSGETLSGRIGDYNGDGYIDGTLVAVGVMPLSSPIFPGQPYALSRNFETDLAIDGIVMGSTERIHTAYE